MQGCGRIIQTLGTPYRGTPLAGILAFLANLFFDYACGYNENLTYSGAERWLSKIPLETRKEVYYYTTQVSDARTYLRMHMHTYTHSHTHTHTKRLWDHF